VGDLATLGKVSGKPLPLKGSLDVSGRVSDPAPKAYRISNLKVALGSSDLAGTVEVQMAGATAGVDGRPVIEKNGHPFDDARGAGSGTAKKAEKSSKEPPKPAQQREKVLPNGLKVLMVKRPYAPLVRCILGYRVHTACCTNSELPIASR
jgi:hypothetical protein